MSRRAVLLEALAATPRDLARMLRPVDAEAAQSRPAPSAWCLADVLCHLASAEERHLACLRSVAVEQPEQPRAGQAGVVGQVGTSSHGEIPGQPAAAETGENGLPTLVEAFANRRAETITFLSSLSQRDWGRIMRGPGIGIRGSEDEGAGRRQEAEGSLGESLSSVAMQNPKLVLERSEGSKVQNALDRPVRLRDYVQGIVAHDNEHLAQIVMLREALEKE